MRPGPLSLFTCRTRQKKLARRLFVREPCVPGDTQASSRSVHFRPGALSLARFRTFPSLFSSARVRAERIPVVSECDLHFLLLSPLFSLVLSGELLRTFHTQRVPIYMHLPDHYLTAPDNGRMGRFFNARAELYLQTSVDRTDLFSVGG